ncbi:abnormal spindle-like microcephaly-associated protein homolog [Drosophila albomicans]|uniref:Abnormal spindle-like microcephaly-associated protein homolog n=1 Tax=Drosophila albomicans TaxID=7291 RepID=A0A9C6W4H3_DROAB|nr:abnormal spindle-like microcephaly-associated protein homolog [Drosophila albomicans]
MWTNNYWTFTYRNTLASISNDFKSTDEYESETTESKGLPSTYLNNALRTQLLLLDYKQFKAARIIQKTFRGWRVRNHMVKQSNAAEIIQRVWRRYLVGRNLQMIAEEKVQQSMVILFNSSSIKIQASFRGWWTRKHVNNTSYLHTLQLNAVQYILYEMIGSLHTMKRSNVLPGISTFYNQECMDKVQNLLSTLSYRMYNEVVARRQLRANFVLRKIWRCGKNRSYILWCPIWVLAVIRRCITLTWDPPQRTLRILVW